MPKFAANLSMMFNEVPFLDRFAAAREAGFQAVEYLFPYDSEPEVGAQKLRENHLENVLFNMPPGNWSAGERGIASLPGREEEFRAGVEKALAYAAALGVTRLHAMAGIPPAPAALPSHLNREPEVRCRKTGAAPDRTAPGGHQYTRYAGFFCFHPGRFLCHLLRGERSQSQNADRLLPHADDGS